MGSSGSAAQLTRRELFAAAALGMMAGAVARHGPRHPKGN